jgi:L-proline amide hydrolase
MPKVKWIHLDQSSHMPFWEEPERYFEAVTEFLEL